MAFELIAAIVASLAAAGMMMALRKITGKRLPKWIVPVTTGLALFGYASWSEYSWFGRSLGVMQAGTVVTWRHESRDLWRPWSYLYPVVDRFAAVNTATIKRHPQHPGIILADVILASRWTPNARLVSAFDCINWRRAEVARGKASVTEAGELLNLDWTSLPHDDVAFRALCRTP